MSPFNWNNGQPSIFCPKQKSLETPADINREKTRLREAAKRAAERVNREQSSCSSNATKSARAPR
jgi:hypothetical protein